MGNKKKPHYACVGNSRSKYTARLKKANQARKKEKEDKIQLNHVVYTVPIEYTKDEREKDVNLRNTTAVSKDLHLSKVEEAQSTSVPLRLHSTKSVVASRAAKKGLKLPKIEKNDTGESRLAPPEESPRLRPRGNSKKRSFSISSQTTAATSHNRETLTQELPKHTQISEEETNELNMSLIIEIEEEIMPISSQTAGAESYKHGIFFKEQPQGKPDEETHESTIEKDGDTMQPSLAIKREK